MRLVILKETNTVGKNGWFYDNLDLTSCNLPENLWALQWYDNNTGHIEYNSPLLQNDEITELPTWANECLSIWQVAEQARLAAEAEQAILAAEAEQARLEAEAEAEAEAAAAAAAESENTPAQ